MFNFAREAPQFKKKRGVGTRSDGDETGMGDVQAIVPARLRKAIDDAAGEDNQITSRKMAELVFEWCKWAGKQPVPDYGLEEIQIDQAIADIITSRPGDWSRRWALGLLCLASAYHLTLERILQDPKYFETVKKYVDALNKEDDK